MAESGEKIERTSDTGASKADGLDGARLGERLGERRRRRKRRQSTAVPRLFAWVGIGLFCVTLIMVGVIFGAKFQTGQINDEPYQTGQINDEPYRKALEERKKAQLQRLSECEADGHSVWMCNTFDQEHFDTAKQLDEFDCQVFNGASYQCSYTLGSAKVVVTLPQIYEEDGRYLAPTVEPGAIVSHSDEQDKYFVSVSEQGYIEIREQGQDAALFAINLMTGRLHSPQ